jgi:hypothetical protein
MNLFTKMNSWLLLVVLGLFLFPKANVAQEQGARAVPAPIPLKIDPVKAESFSVICWDSYGDGWNGATMDVFVNGTMVLENIHCDGTETVYTFDVEEGDMVETEYTSGFWEGENTYAFYDQWGFLVASDGPSPGSGISFEVVFLEPKIAVTPDPLDLGEWPIGGWQEMEYFEISNTGDAPASIESGELDDEDGVFNVMNPDFSDDLGPDDDPLLAGVAFTGVDVDEGMYEATYVVSWGGGGKFVSTAVVMAEGYEAVVGDIVEKPFEVTVPHSDAGVSTDSPMRQNYNLPGTTTNGKDVVYNFTLTEDQLVDITISNATETPNMALYTADFGGEGGPMVTNAIANASTTAEDLQLFADEYFLVVSSTTLDAAMTFDIDITSETMPDPECIVNPMPEDAATGVPASGSVASWEYGEYVQEYQLLFGTSVPLTQSDNVYGADEWRPATPGGDSFALPDLGTNMQYFWQVNVRNGNATVECDFLVFTTTITPPSDLTAVAEEREPIGDGVFDVTLSWTGSTSDGKVLLGYNAYRSDDGGATFNILNDDLISGTTYVDEDVPYNTDPCYQYYVEAVFDEGVSDPSNIATTCVTGYGTLEGTVTALLTGDPIFGAEVRIEGATSYTVNTGADGTYSQNVLEGCYTVTVVADGFITEVREDVCVDYDETTVEDFELDEFPFPALNVVAEETSDDQVQVTWNSPGFDGAGGIVEDDFEGGEVPDWFVPDAPETDWVVADGLLTLATGGTGVWRSGYHQDMFSDVLFEVSQTRDVGGSGGSMGVFVNSNGHIDLTVGSGANANMFTWTDNGFWWYGTLTDGDLPDWTGWATTTAINTGLGELNVITSEVVAGNVTFYINSVAITTQAVAADEGFLGGFGFTGTVPTEMSFDYWNIVPGGSGKGAIVIDDKQFEGKGSYEQALSSYTNTTDVEVKGLDVNTRPSSADKELTGYNVYRAICGEPTPAEFLGFVPDTTFSDNTWGGVDWGIYMWGVEAVYTNNNAEIAWSNCLDKDMFITVGVEVTTNNPGEDIGECDVLFVNNVETDFSYGETLTGPQPASVEWDPFRRGGPYNISVMLFGYGEVMLEDVFIPNDTVFEFTLIELLLPPTNLYVTPLGFATWDGVGEVPFEPYMNSFDTQEDFDMWEVVDGGNTAGTWQWVTQSANGNTLDGTPFAYVDSDAEGFGVTMDEQLISPVINASNTDELFLVFDLVHQQIGDVLNFDVWDGEAWVNVGSSEADTGPFPWGPTATIELDISELANDELRVRFQYIAGWDWFVGIDNVKVTNDLGKYSDKAFEYYGVWHEGGNILPPADTTFYDYASQPESPLDLVPGETYLACVDARYSTGISPQTCYEWTYLPCDSFPSWLIWDAYNVDPDNFGDDNLVVWTDNPNFSPIEEDFEDGLPEGWFTLTNSAVGWFFTTDGSSAFWTIPPGDGIYACSNDDEANDDGSFDYLVTPEMDFTGLQQVTLNFSSFYNGLYGTTATVEVTTDGAQTWTVVETLDAETSWTEIEVDLSAYAGEESIWVGFHANDNGAWASGWAVDNVSITSPQVGKDDSEVIGTNVYRDGEMIAYVPLPDTFYLDSNLEPGFYDYCVAKVYSADEGLHSWTSCLDATCVLDVPVYEECLAPQNLVASDELGDGYTATLIWEAPVTFEPIWLDYGVEENVDGIGGPTEFSAAIKWDPADLQAIDGLDGASMTKIKFFPREAGSSYTLRIWKGPNAGTLIHEQPLTSVNANEWNEVDLSTSVPIDVNDELWVGYYVVTTGFPAGCGNYMGNPNSDLVSLDGVLWERLNDFGLPYSWNLGVYAEASKGGVIELPVIEDGASYSNGANTELVAGNLEKPVNAVDPFTNSKVLECYNVYRSAESGGPYELIAECVTETTYLDDLGEYVPGGYCYMVRAVYMNCEGSEDNESVNSNEACVVPGVGLEELESNISVYPNPAKEFIIVESTNDIRSIEITNYMGQVVHSVKAVEMTKRQVNTNTLSAGVYFVKVETDTGIEQVRIVISE